jgi:hypothetical protein
LGLDHRTGLFQRACQSRISEFYRREMKKTQDGGKCFRTAHILGMHTSGTSRANKKGGSGKRKTVGTDGD